MPRVNLNQPPITPPWCREQEPHWMPTRKSAGFPLAVIAYLLQLFKVAGIVFAHTSRTQCDARAKFFLNRVSWELTSTVPPIYQTVCLALVSWEEDSFIADTKVCFFHTRRADNVMHVQTLCFDHAARHPSKSLSSAQNRYLQLKVEYIQIWKNIQESFDRKIHSYTTDVTFL